jgi:hypothetical protein
MDELSKWHVSYCLITHKMTVSLKSKVLSSKCRKAKNPTYDFGLKPVDLTLL